MIRRKIFKAGQWVGTVLGTSHVLPRHDPLQERVKEVLQGATVLALELSPEDQVTLGDLMDGSAQDSFNQRHPGLEGDAMRAAMARYGVERVGDALVSDGVVACVIGMAIAHAVGGEVEYGTEELLMKQWQGRVMGLETIQSQLAHVRSMSKVASDPVVALDVSEDLHRQIFHGIIVDDIDYAAKAWSVLSPTMLDQPIVAGRNKDMVAGIISLLQTGEWPVIAVGAVHLPGEKGILALLEAEGYVITKF